jgi:hypothetical protein
MSLRHTCLSLIAVAAIVGVPACSGGTPATPAPAAASAFPFNVGAKWTYRATITPQDAQAVTGTATLELLQLEGTAAAFRLASNFANLGERTTEFKGDIRQNPYSTAERVGAPTTESVTVPAGTFTATKETSRLTQPGGEDTFEYWYDASRGLLKLVETSKVGTRVTVSTYELQ